MSERTLSQTLHGLLGIPESRCELAPEFRGEAEVNGIVIEKWLFTAEPGSRIPLALCRPREVTGRIPAVVQTCGHGGSKGVAHVTYVAQTYARLGIACLTADPLGEEERNIAGEMGTREHDKQDVAYRCELAGRSVMGKFVFDAMRALDFLQTREWVDPNRLGVMGNSLGGAIASWLFALEPRSAMTIVSGWAMTDFLRRTGKHCTRVPYLKLRSVCDWNDFLALAPAENALLVMNGDADVVIDGDSSGIAWRDVQEHLFRADPDQARLKYWNCPEGGHRPYQGYKRALQFVHCHLGSLNVTEAELAELPEINYGEWCDTYGVELEKLYGTSLHYRGAVLPDLGLRPVPREHLAVLTPDEIGSSDFTIGGWLKTIGGQPQ